MAIGKKSGGRDFKPGHKYGSLGGRPSLPEELRHIKKLTKTEIDAYLSKFLRMDLEGLKEVLDDPKRLAIEHFICKVIVIGVGTGDPVRLSFLLDRLVGRPTGEKKIIEVRKLPEGKDES